MFKDASYVPIKISFNTHFVVLGLATPKTSTFQYIYEIWQYKTSN